MQRDTNTGDENAQPVKAPWAQDLGYNVKLTRSYNDNCNVIQEFGKTIIEKQLVMQMFDPRKKGSKYLCTATHSGNLYNAQ